MRGQPKAGPFITRDVVNMNRIVMAFLRFVNRRICSAEEFNMILEDMRLSAKFDVDGYITIGEMIKYLVRSFKFIRGGTLAR